MIKRWLHWTHGFTQMSLKLVCCCMPLSWWTCQMYTWHKCQNFCSLCLTTLHVHHAALWCGLHMPGWQAERRCDSSTEVFKQHARGTSEVALYICFGLNVQNTEKCRLLQQFSAVKHGKDLRERPKRQKVNPNHFRIIVTSCKISADRCNANLTFPCLHLAFKLQNESI